MVRKFSVRNLKANLGPQSSVRYRVLEKCKSLKIKFNKFKNKLKNNRFKILD